MPFGAQPLADGRVRFSLWAPDAGRVDVCLEEAGSTADFALPAGEDGWFTLTTEAARAGARYRFRIDGKLLVPDPASRFQPDGVNGPSEVVDAAGYEWQGAWEGRPWAEAVVYELHVGTFTAGGTFSSACERLPYLAELGITVIEVLPVATFAGNRNWGYDGVLLYAPHPAYGTPDQFRAFVERAQSLGIMVLLDVVYNHFGPEGNYLNSYASPFFTRRHQTPWGDAINFDGPGSRAVRDFFIHNALYWLQEFRLDGLRLDAVHAIADDSTPDILEELAAAVRDGPGRERQVHLVLENHANEAHRLKQEPRAGGAAYAAQWNDDYHHACHVILTDESDGYYVDYADNPHVHLARCLSEGFAYQGEASKYQSGKHRGESSGHLPLTSFIGFLQNHDMVGNRAFGERLVELAPAPALRALTSILLMNPAVPGLFMGEEFGCSQPFLYFADFDGELAEAVRRGRKREFARFAAFADSGAANALPDPIDVSSFRRSVLQWDELDDPAHAEWLEFYRELIDLRRRFVVPGLPAEKTVNAQVLDSTGLRVDWQLRNAERLTLVANLGARPLKMSEALTPDRRQLHAVPADAGDLQTPGELPPWSAIWQIGGEHE